MKKVLATVIGGLLLSGCALPVPIQIASWALDGFSLIATKKSITDHGISIVAQKDCALWRGVTEGEVCREDDPMALIADRGDVVDSAEPGEQKTSLISSLTTSSSSFRKSESVETRVVSWQPGPSSSDGISAESIEPIVVNTDLPVSVEQKQELADVQEEQAPQWQFVSQENETIAPETDDLVSYSATPGDYFVIGSFGVWDNAKRFANKHTDVDAQILAANVADYRVFRIVVGPYTDSNQSELRKSIRNAGMEDIWAVRVPADEITLAWRSSDAATELAAIASD